MSELPDEFISALLRDGATPDVDLDSAYAGVTRRVQQVRRRRLVVASGVACVALFGAVVFAGSRLGSSDDVTVLSRRGIGCPYDRVERAGHSRRECIDQRDF